MPESPSCRKRTAGDSSDDSDRRGVAVRVVVQRRPVGGRGDALQMRLLELGILPRPELGGDPAGAGSDRLELVGVRLLAEVPDLDLARLRGPLEQDVVGDRLELGLEVAAEDVAQERARVAFELEDEVVRRLRADPVAQLLAAA